MLRQKIGQRLASGPGGLLRCWVNFRQRAGASKEGITASEWERGLKMYGVPLNKARARKSCLTAWTPVETATSK